MSIVSYHCWSAPKFQKKIPNKKLKVVHKLFEFNELPANVPTQLDLIKSMSYSKVFNKNPIHT